MGDILKISNFSDGVFASIPDIKQHDRLFAKLSGVCINSLAYNQRYSSHGCSYVPCIESVSIEGSLPIGSNSRFVPVGTANQAEQKTAPDKKAA
jgi:hypothetical protein